MGRCRVVLVKFVLPAPSLSGAGGNWILVGPPQQLLYDSAVAQGPCPLATPPTSWKKRDQTRRPIYGRFEESTDPRIDGLTDRVGRSSRGALKVSAFKRLFALGLGVVLGIAILGVFFNGADLQALTALQQTNLQSVFRSKYVYAPDPPNFNIDVTEFTLRVNGTIAQARAIYDEVAAAYEPSFDEIVKISSTEALLNTLGPLYFLGYVSPEKAIRDRANEVLQVISDYEVEASMRIDVYRTVKKIYDSAPLLGLQAQRYLDDLMLQYRRDGLTLPDDARQRLLVLRQGISATGIEFNKNLGEDEGGIWFTKDELAGVPEDLVQTWKARNSTGHSEHWMSFQYPDVGPTLKYARLETTRRRAWVAKETRVPQNANLMVEMIKLRRDLAELLGQPTFADYALQDKMAKNATNVMNFLEDLHTRALPLARDDLEELRTVKKLQDNSTDPLKIWDEAWASTLLLDQNFQYKSDVIAEYYEKDHTVQEIFAIYETLFSLRFVALGRTDGQYDVWHEDVQQFSVWRTDTKDFVGWLYLDLFPREGKYGHAANMDIRTRVPASAGRGPVSPATALVCNFSKPSKTRPSLLKPAEVQTFFHELGHGIHSLLTDTEWFRFNSLSAVEHDFVEAPSQMLENWLSSNDILQRISRHYKTGEPLSVEQIERINAVDRVNRALSVVGQVQLALFDMKIHTDYNGTTTTDLIELWNSIKFDAGLSDSTPEKQTAGLCSFMHIMDGYEAGYYGYLYSRVFSADMYRARFAGRERDPLVGAEYRDLVLVPGGSRDSLESITAFLGRSPNNLAFLGELGLQGSDLISTI